MSTVHKKKTLLTPTRRNHEPKIELQDGHAESKQFEASIAPPPQEVHAPIDTRVDDLLARVESLEAWRKANFGS